MRGSLAGLLVAIALQHAQAGTPEAAWAARIDEGNFARAIRGPGAEAGIGDWMLSNGTLCASIAAIEHETYLSTTGGSLIDLGYCGRDDDQWAVYQDLANLSREAVFGASDITASASADEAVITVTGGWGGIRRTTRYVLGRAAPEELRIETTLTRAGASDRLALFGSLVLHTSRSLTPFVVSTTAPQWSKGFVHPHVDTRDRSAMAELLFPADLSVLIGPARDAPEISYGLHSAPPERVDADGERTVLRQFAIDDADFSMIGSFSDTPWFDNGERPGLLQLAQLPLMDLDEGASLEIRRRILVAPRADAAAITDRIYTGGTLRGRTDSADNRVLVSDAEGHPLSFLRPGPDGSFALRLPAGIERARLVLSTPFRESVLAADAVADAAAPLELLAAPHTGVLVMPADGTPMRVVLRGRNGTPDPMFGSDLRGFSVGEAQIPPDAASNGVSLTGTGADPREIALPAGDYTVYATRGPEYSLEKADVRIVQGERVAPEWRTPRRVLRSRHWISADLHVHGEYSFDSTLGARARIADFVAQGGEVLVATEHSRVVDYQPIVQSMGLSHLLVAVTGTELTGMAHGDRLARTIGHDNVFPLQADPQQYRGGLLPQENRRLGEVIGAWKALDPRVVFQLNHPRNLAKPDDDLYFFNHLGVDRRFDPAQPLAAETNRSLIETLPGSPFRDIDFDAIEIMNGARIANYHATREDWFALLRQGHRMTATGNSDSHSAAEIVAMPRNYVRTEGTRLDEEAVERFDLDAFVDAIHRGRSFVTTGPLLDVRLDGQGPGRTVRGRHADLAIRVRAADWIGVERMRVFVNGALVRESPASRHGTHEISLDFARDSFVTVEVEGSAGGDYRAVYPGFTPIAFSNPIWVDADGDGEWTAPGFSPR